MMHRSIRHKMESLGCTIDREELAGDTAGHVRYIARKGGAYAVWIANPRSGAAHSFSVLSDLGATYPRTLVQAGKLVDLWSTEEPPTAEDLRSLIRYGVHYGKNF